MDGMTYCNRREPAPVQQAQADGIRLIPPVFG